MEWHCYSPHFNFGDGQKEKRKRNLLDTCFTDPADAAATHFLLFSNKHSYLSDSAALTRIV